MRLTSHRLRGNPPIRGFRWGVPMACSAKSRISSNGADFRRRESLHIMALSEVGSPAIWKPNLGGVLRIEGDIKRLTRSCGD